jgi:hypothetical protein
MPVNERSKGYWPLDQMMERLAAYANETVQRHYYSLEGGST